MMIYVGGWLPRGMQPPEDPGPERWYVGENKPGGKGYWIDVPPENPTLKEFGWKDVAFFAACLAIAVLPALLRKWLR